MTAEVIARLVYLRAELSRLHLSSGTLFAQSLRAAEIEREIKLLESS